MRTIGKIDREIYKCITDEFSAYFGQIIERPDYIIESRKPNTALILKQKILYKKE